MKRREQVARHNRNLDEAFAAAQRGEVICLSALIGGAEEIYCDDLDGKDERAESCYSDNWKVPKVE